MYYLLSGRRLMYVGTASNLRRRLADHQRSGRWSDITGVRWELLRSAGAALAREAAVLAALAPPRNKSHLDRYFIFVQVAAGGLMLGGEGDYGCIPHLGRGAMSAPGRACIDGFDALDRIVRVTNPPSGAVEDLLTGRSDGLLRLELDIDQPHVRHGVERDRQAAQAFYEAGPLAMRVLRLRHGGRGVVTRPQFVEWIASEVAELIGPFH